MPESEPSVGSVFGAHKKIRTRFFSQRGGGGHTEILRTYVQIYVGCTKDDVTTPGLSVFSSLYVARPLGFFSVGKRQPVLRYGKQDSE